MSILLPSSVCIARRGEATPDVSATPCWIREPHLCFGPPLPTTWKWFKPFSLRALHPTSTRWVSHHSWSRRVSEPAANAEELEQQEAVAKLSRSWTCFLSTART